MKGHKLTSARSAFDKWPTSLLSHDVFAPDESVMLSPFARVRIRGEGGNTAKSAIRALDILELMARSGTPLRAVEIACAFDLSPSSAHQVLKTLQDAAYLIFDPASKRYHPSMRAANFARLLAGCNFEPGAIERLIGALHLALEMTITISASQGRFMQIVDVFEPRHRPGAPWSVSTLRQKSIGLRVPIFGSCTGAAWLSAQSDDIVLSTARLCRRALGEHSTDDHQEILEIVRRVRQQGYGFGGISPDDATRAIAVPFPRGRDGTVQVVAVSAPAEEMRAKRDEIVLILKEQIVRHLKPHSRGSSERLA